MVNKRRVVNKYVFVYFQFFTQLICSSNRLWEAVNQYMSVCKTEILEAADEWVARQTKIAKERLAVKLAFHKPRYERLEYSIYKKRMMEINYHTRRFESHKMVGLIKI